MKSTNKNKNSVIFISAIVAIIVLSLVIFIAYHLLQIEETNNTDRYSPNSVTSNAVLKEQDEQHEKKEQFTNIRIAATGDIMFHDTQLQSAFDEASGTYDFKSFFEDVKPILSLADLTIANFESTLGGPDMKYTGYPLFNSPDEVVDAIQYAGIDVVTTANNHSLDTGSEGLKRTIHIFREKGIDTVGTFDEKPNSRVLLKDIKGVKIAILSYTESTNGLGKNYSTKALNDMLNLMDKERIVRDIQEAKDLNADFIISYMHWGDEYAEEPNAKQIEYAQTMAQEGVDLILGSHPHVIQRSEVIETKDRQTFVIYSMGNFISNQRKETLGSEREMTEDGVIILADIKKNHETNETTIEHIEYIPTWVYRHQEDGQSKYTYRILPIEDFLMSDEIAQTYKRRMERSFDSTVSKMEKEPF